MKKVLMFLGEGFEALEAAAFSDVMGWSVIHGTEPVYLTTFGLRENIKSKWNFTVEPELLIDDIDITEYDALALPGGFGDAGFYEDAYDKRMLELVRRFSESDMYIASICVGALILGKAGVLSNRKATTYDTGEPDRISELKEFGAIFHKESIVIDGNIITSNGPSTAIPVAFELLRMLTNDNNLELVKKFMRFN